MNKYGSDIIINHPIFEEGKMNLQLCFDDFGQSPEPRCTPIFGPSGSGKSTMISEFEKKIGKGNGRSKPVVVINTPGNPTVKSMASRSLQSVCDPMYFRGTEIQMTSRFIGILDELETQMLIFDNMQNLIDQESEKLCVKASDWLRDLIDEAKRPVAIFGLERTDELFFVNEQLRRRFTEAFIIEPFNWHKPSTRQMLKGFLKALQQRLHFEDGLEIFSDEMAFRFYCASGGLVSYLMKIVREAERLASSDCIGLNHLAQAYNKAVCGNRFIGVNPFSNAEIERLEAALLVVDGSKKQKRKAKEKLKLENT